MPERVILLYAESRELEWMEIRREAGRAPAGQPDSPGVRFSGNQRERRSIPPSGKRSGRRSAPPSKHGRISSKARRRKRRRRIRTCVLILVLLLCIGAGKLIPYALRRIFPNEAERFLQEQEGKQEYPQKLLELLENNKETLDFVKGYPERENYVGQPIDLSGDYDGRNVPLLMQWDKRWGYDSYGDGMIGLEGCGPTCLTMAYLYLTGDTGMNPRSMAEFAYENGYYTMEGTSWSLWTEGVKSLGLSGVQLSLSESSMKQALDDGGLIVCSMRPGDFTTKGHFILICGYDKNGFFVKDPNRRSNSEKQWDYPRLSSQIKNLWKLFR